MKAIALLKPNAELLPGYVAALRTGWSPSNTRDLSGTHLAAIEADPAAFLSQYDNAPALAKPPADAASPLRGEVFWISDGSFCGFLSFRYQPGTLALPASTTGHVGYGVVPWKRGGGVATAALRALRPVAWAAGLEQVLITAAPDNDGSRRVIEKAGGVAAGLAPAGAFGPQSMFWLPTGP